MRKCVPNDYTFWDKFDADSEALKLDLEEERLAEKKAMERKQQEERQKLKMKQQLDEENLLRERMKNAVGAGNFNSLCISCLFFESYFYGARWLRCVD